MITISSSETTVLSMIWVCHVKSVWTKTESFTDVPCRIITNLTEILGVVKEVKLWIRGNSQHYDAVYALLEIMHESEVTGCCIRSSDAPN